MDLLDYIEPDGGSKNCREDERSRGLCGRSRQSNSHIVQFETTNRQR
jgi:hypothetical protein